MADEALKNGGAEPVVVLAADGLAGNVLAGNGANGEALAPESSSSSSSRAARSAKLPYSSPKLTSLGTVAELTFGGHASVSDGAGTHQAG
jgi:hypothetical protein